MRTLNLGFLTGVDAGKTGLSERLFHAARIIDETGRNVGGITQTYAVALEWRRGITINPIDTPGLPGNSATPRLGARVPGRSLR